MAVHPTNGSCQSAAGWSNVAPGNTYDGTFAGFKVFG